VEQPPKPRKRRRQRTKTVRKLFEGRLRIEQRPPRRAYYARVCIQGKLLVKSTGETTIAAAKRVAGEWYRDLLARARTGELIHGRSFEDVAEKFLKHAEQVKAVSEGQRRNYRQKWDLLKPHFKGVKVTDIDARFLLELRQKRADTKTKNGTKVKPTTLKKDLVFVRLVLQHAKEWEKCLDELPEFPSFRGDAWAVLPSPRPFLSHEQWTKVRELAKDRAEEKGLNPRTQRQRQELYWFLLICVGAALRVGEAQSLRWRDCDLTKLDDADKTDAVHMMVLGKHSRGGKREDAFGLFGAVSAFKAMKAARPDAKPDDLLFLENHREGMKELLTAAGLRTDADGRTRDAKSLRQTGISLRLDMGPANIDYRDAAKWARTSPAMIATFYDQTHPKASVGRIAGFRNQPPTEEERKAKTPSSPKKQTGRPAARDRKRSR
jgi:integrase